MKTLKLGVLAFQGDVAEHIRALKKAAINLNLHVSIVEVRNTKELQLLSGLIIPGGESTTLFKLCEREGMLEAIKEVPAIFGTCAGAIMLAKKVLSKSEGQKSLGLMDIEIDRNAYGRQAESFEGGLDTKLGRIEAIYIRAPRILKKGKSVRILAERDGEVLACEEKVGPNYYLAACFHPELTTSVFHEYFLEHLANN